MAQPGSLSSPAQLLELLDKRMGGGGDEQSMEELLESVRAGGGGAAPPLGADQVEVFPEPGFVIKTANEQGQKVFINMCGSAKLPLPGGWQKGQAVPEEVKQHLEAARGGEAPEAMRFPLSLGPPRLDTDHRGQPCLVLDCIVSSEVLAQCGQYRPLKLFVIQLALGLVAQKCDLELDPQYKLPKMRYKGDAPPPQRIRAEGGGSASSSGGGLVTPQQQQKQQQSGGSSSSTKPLIAEVGPDGEEAPAFALLASKRQQRQQQAAAAGRKPAQAAQQQPSAGPGSSIGAAGAQQQQGQTPTAVTEQLQPQIEYIGMPVTAVDITLPLPAAVAAAAQQDPAAISAAVCTETVRVQVPGCQAVEVRLPFAVSAAGGSAELHAADAATSGSSLVLRLPYQPFSSVLEELQQAAGAVEGGCRGSLMELD